MKANEKLRWGVSKHASGTKKFVVEIKSVSKQMPDEYIVRIRKLLKSTLNAGTCSYARSTKVDVDNFATSIGAVLDVTASHAHCRRLVPSDHEAQIIDELAVGDDWRQVGGDLAWAMHPKAVSRALRSLREGK